MVECQKCLDPTAFGLFLVATVSLPLAMASLLDMQLDGPTLFTYGGVLILLVALLAYRSDSNFGFVVFGLVGFAVLFTGISGGGDAWSNLTFGIMFILAIIWSILVKTPKNLTLILVTTALIFLVVGINNGYPDVFGDNGTNVLGVVALLNFLFNVYMAFALALDGKLPVL
jgi:hypothetical protein